MSRRAPGPAPTLAVCAVASIVLAPARANAYVQARTDDGAGLSWRGTDCVPIVIYPRGFSEMTADEVANAATSAAAAWSQAQITCTYLTITMMESAADGPISIPQPHAAVVFRETAWCKVLPDGTCSKAAADVARYDEAAIMLTSDSVSVKTGEIYEGATEVNVFDWKWADLVAHPELGRDHMDLQNALTHEFGHFIGLDHTCFPPGTTPWPIDDQGRDAASCDNTPGDVEATTMYPSATFGDINKRTLEADDVRGACGLYPVVQDPRACVVPTLPQGGGGCACQLGDGDGDGDGGASRPARSAFGAAAVALMALGARRRGAARRRSPRPRPLC
jgi:hypothetical protein